MPQDCLFCKIISGEVPSYRIYEDNEHLAVLDIFPINKGQVWITTKNHYTSKYSLVDDEVLCKLLKVTKKVAQNIENKLEGVERCQIVVEGFHTDHLHFKLFPAFNPDPAKDAVVHMGEKASDDVLETMQAKLKM